MDINEISESVLSRVIDENDIADFAELVRACRSYRRFDPTDPVEVEFLAALIDIARFVASGRNQQALRYRIVCDPEPRDLVFSKLKFAANLPWSGPEPHERPSGYIVLCTLKPKTDLKLIDCGIAAQTMALAASDAGYGCCMFKSFPTSFTADIGLDAEKYDILLVMGFGKPAEQVVLEPATTEHGLEYWRDEAGVHHVPKLELADVLI